MEKDLKQKKASTSRRTSLVKPFKKTDSAKTGAVKTTQKQTKNKVNSNKLELLITIVSRQKAEFYVDLIQSFEVNMQMVLAASGTASTETLRYLGLSESEKSVILSVIREDRVKEALDALDERFKTLKNGKGIAYTVPMTSTIGVAIYQFLTNNKK